MITILMSVCIVQKVYRKKCNQALIFFLEIYDTETMLGRRHICGGYYTTFAPLWNFTQPLMVISFRLLGKNHWSHLWYPNIPRIPNITQSVRCVYTYKLSNATFHVVIKNSATEYTNIITNLYKINIASYISGYQYT